MKIKVNFVFWQVVKLLIKCAISMQVAALVGKMVVNMLQDSGAPPLVILLTALLSLLGSVIITAKALFRFDAWLDSWMGSKKGRKYRIQILNIPRAWSIWLVDESAEGGVYNSELDHHGVFGVGFFRIKHGYSLFQRYRNQRFSAYRFWRFSVEFGNR